MCSKLLSRSDSSEFENTSVDFNKFRSSHHRYSAKQGVLKNVANFTGKHQCWSLLLIKTSRTLLFLGNLLQSLTLVCSNSVLLHSFFFLAFFLTFFFLGDMIDRLGDALVIISTERNQPPGLFYKERCS